MQRQRRPTVEAGHGRVFRRSGRHQLRVQAPSSPSTATLLGDGAPCAAAVFVKRRLILSLALTGLAMGGGPPAGLGQGVPAPSGTFWGDCFSRRKLRGKYGDLVLAQIQLTKWKIIRKDGCRIINCPTNSKNHNCQHKQKTVNRAIPKGILQNHQLPYKRSKRKLLFSMNHRTPRKRQQIIRFGYTASRGIAPNDNGLTRSVR